MTDNKRRDHVKISSKGMALLNNPSKTRKVVNAIMKHGSQLEAGIPIKVDDIIITSVITKYSNQ